ncbi:putative F-box protein At5g62660 isoform X2 [Capsella rubella]|uniref:putative F-box protein At5g62660 isoform X2 n=1 Tax=Capsella rubella TaxID=81985 RepID=UPI000CD57F51|nr:putative F-box protein At5g62660 isoform X2 [Capsella rubella]
MAKRPELFAPTNSSKDAGTGPITDVKDEKPSRSSRKQSPAESHLSDAQNSSKDVLHGSNSESKASPTAVKKKSPLSLTKSDGPSQGTSVPRQLSGTARPQNISALISSTQWKKKSSKGMSRGRRRQRGEDLVAPEIPLDLQIEILTRLPARSLMRFKCVSKLWSSLIRSRFFSNRYLKVASPRPRPPRLYMSLVEHLKCNSMGCNSMEICQKPRETVLLSSSSTSANSFDPALTMPGIGGRNMVILRGLILYFVCRQACIYNPTTRQSLTLPAVKSNLFAKESFRQSVLYFLGHDPVLDQYKVVCTVVRSSKRYKKITSEHWVLVLEAGGSWKRIEFDKHHLPTRPGGVCINGVIYYMASTGLFPRAIVSFDVRSEEFNMFQAPRVLPELGWPVGFIEYAGKPTIVDHSLLNSLGLVDLWVLEDAGKWSTKSLVLKLCQMHLVDKDIDLTVEGITQNGEVIFAHRPLIYPSYILYYDLQKNDLRKVRIRGIPLHWFNKPDASLYSFFKHMDKSESIMHLEI